MDAGQWATRWSAIIQRRPTARFLFGSTIIAVLAHFAVWKLVANRLHEPVAARLNAWDAAHYSDIVERGYDSITAAFYPLYPALIVELRAGTASPALIGTALSLLLFLCFVLCVSAVVRSGDATIGIAPLTRAGWLCFLAAPAAYVFHSNHTESLFLVLSYVAIAAAANRSVGLACLAAGLAMLTRNQGAFVFLAVGLLLLANAKEKREFAIRGLIVCAAGLASIAALLWFEYAANGNALAFAQAQGNWSHVHSPWESVKALWFGNSWQVVNADNVMRYLAFWAFVVMAVVLARLNWPLGVYVAVSLLPLLVQGEFVVTFRFGSVLFPAFFSAGDLLAKKTPRVATLVIAVLAALSLAVARRYIRGEWAY